MKNFIWRKYVSVGLAFSFLLISLSGVILYIAPPGRVARWVDWSAFGLNRAQWETLHTLFSLLFLVFGIIHLFNLNWKAFISYFTNGFANRIRSKKEAFAAVLTIIALFLLTVFKVPPVYSVMELGNRISDNWSKKIGEPPVVAVENMTITELAELFYNSDSEALVASLSSEGFKIGNVSQSLKEIAEQNSVSPMDIFKLIGE